MQLAGRTARKTTAGVLLSSFLQTYAAGWKNKKKNNSRWSTPAGEPVALQGLLTEAEPTQGQSAKSFS